MFHWYACLPSNQYVPGLVWSIMVQSTLQNSIAYIPLRHKISVDLEPQCQNFELGVPTCWYLKARKFVLPPTPNLKICVTPNANPQSKFLEHRLRLVPNATFSHWQCIFHFIGNVYFTFLVLISFVSFVFGGQHKPSLQWSMGL